MYRRGFLRVFIWPVSVLLGRDLRMVRHISRTVVYSNPTRATLSAFLLPGDTLAHRCPYFTRLVGEAPNSPWSAYRGRWARWAGMGRNPGPKYEMLLERKPGIRCAGMHERERESATMDPAIFIMNATAGK